ncbi:MAG: glycosyltransferase family protein [Candidatus Hodarchaeales archaeon]
MVDCPFADKANAYVAEQATFAFANDLLSAQVMGVPYLPTAYCEEIHHPMIVSDRYHSDVVFVGTGFPERIRMLEAVDWTGIDLKILGYFNPRKDSPIQQYIHKHVTQNSEVAQFYCGAKLVLNLDRTSVDFEGMEQIDQRGSVGPRIYEAAACSAAIISQDTVPELGNLLGESYISFDTPEELVRQVRKWLEHDKRVQMGKNARMAIEGHSYKNRAVALLDTI